MSIGEAKARDQNVENVTFRQAPLPDETLARPALRALRRGEPSERALAAGLLAKWGDVDAVRPLIQAAVMDREAGVRSAAVAALRAIDHPDTARPLARVLDPRREVAACGFGPPVITRRREAGDESPALRPQADPAAPGTPPCR